MEDVIIIGGGVGGLVAAKTLAESGIKPLLLERRKGFGQKACGEMVAEEFCGFTLYDFLKDKSIILREFNRMVINFYGKKYFFNLKSSILGFKKLLQINKKAFEEYLTKEARKFGAKILLGKTVNEIKREGNSILINNKLRAKILIGADGFHSITRKFTGQIAKNYGFAISGYGKCEVKYPYFFFNPEIIPEGYGWIFPRRGGEANIGCGSLKIKKVPLFLKEFLEKFNLKIKKIKGAFLPTQLPVKTFFNNIILVGDAACFTDPFWGGGINAAIFSGYLAGKITREAILEDRVDATFLSKYEKEWKKGLYKSLVKNYYFQKIFKDFFLYHKNITSLGLTILSKL